MDIRRLRYLCQLAESGNYTQAAQRLGIAQSALSMAIKKLEEEVGLKLINRAERQMTLTADGQVLFKHAGLILEAVHEAEREIQELKGIESGVVNFGATSMISSYYLPKVLAAFKQRYPGVRINLIEAGTASLQQMLLDSELDLALIRTDKVHDQLRHVELFEEQVMACLPRNHPLAQKPTITMQAFCREPLVLFREGYFLREAVSRYCQQHQLTLDIRFETNLVELLKSLVISGVGISTGLSMILEQEDALVALPFEPPIPLYLGLGWKKSHYLSKAGQAFVEYLQQHL